MQDELTAEQKSYENGIRIFARWIARAYIRDKAGQKSARSQPESNIKEENDNGDQGIPGSHRKTATACYQDFTTGEKAMIKPDQAEERLPFLYKFAGIMGLAVFFLIYAAFVLDF